MNCNEVTELTQMLCNHLTEPLEFVRNFVTKDEISFHHGKMSEWKCPTCGKSIFMKKPFRTGNISDGFHTFDELYHHRAILFSVICNNHKDIAWKSKQHDDPNEPMYDGMFIVGIETPKGQATYHYDIDPYWDIFKVKELERAPKWDGHTPDEAIERIASLSNI